MNLLYCLNGVVAGWHDDAQPMVPASAYGTGVRIIPYADLIGTLQRIGSPPVLPERDTRPYAQPSETIAILTGYSAQVRFNKSTTDVTFTAASGPIPVHSDRESQMLLSNLALYAQTLASTAAIDFTQDGIHYPITAAESISMFNAVNAHIQQCRTIEAQCIADLNPGSTTVTNAVWDGSATTTYTTAAPHNYAVGDTVSISGSNPSTYDGSFPTITGTTGTTIIVDMSTNPGAFVSGGTLAIKSTIQTYDDVDAKFSGV